MDKIAITGLGVVSPSGIGKEQFWTNIVSGKSFIKEITRFDASKYSVKIAGQVENLEKYSSFSERLLKKMDVFSHMALVASEQALQDAGIEIKNENPDQTGIFLGNAIGGWLYAETELRDLYNEGREGVSPYMASAWFPAAPQGQVSIYYQIKGFSKTIVSDRASSSMAIGYAGKILNKNKLDLVLGGGMEAPVTPYALLCCSTYGDLSTKNSKPEIVYRPFDKNRSGCVIGEGAGIVTMERAARANARNAHVYAYITGYGTTCDGVHRISPAEDGRELARAIQIALSDSGSTPEEIDYISLDGVGVAIWDDSEVKALQMVFGNRLKDIHAGCPKSMFGNLLGASGALDLICTILGMGNNIAPPTINIEDPIHNGILCVKNEARELKMKKALIISRGRGGVNTALIVEKA